MEVRDMQMLLKENSLSGPQKVANTIYICGTQGRIGGSSKSGRRLR